MSTKEQMFFIKRLAFLIRADIPVVESLFLMVEQTKHTYKKHIITSVMNDVASGQFLSHSLAKWHIVSEYTINIIYFGESNGSLGDNLEYAALELQKKDALRKKIIGACVYPLVVICATVGITIFLMMYLFPKIIPVFKSLHMTLPLSTRIMMWMSETIRHDGTSIGILLCIYIIVYTLLWKKYTLVRTYTTRILFSIPLFGKILQYYELSNMTRTCGLLLKSGLTESDALPIVEKTTRNIIYRNQIAHMSTCINRGEPLSVYLKTQPALFPHVLTQIISVGERSGNLPQSLLYISELYETEVDNFTKNISSVIEPLLMVTMGIIVGFIAISIITPIYAITQNLHK
jgi:type II secretory pathway component PulF